VELKYITPYQILDVPYEGVLRRFAFKSAQTTDDNPVSDLVNGLSQINLESRTPSRPSAWVVKWDTVVKVDTLNKIESQKPVRLPFELNARIEA